MPPIRRIRAEDLTKADIFSETVLVMSLVVILGMVLVLLRALA